MYSEFIKKLRDKADVFENNEYQMEVIVQDYRNCAKVIEYLVEKQQPKTDWIPCEDVLSMSESDFITHILSTICDYAKVNNYEITETVKAMGENLIALTEIANFDKWKEGVTDDE